MTAHVPFKVVYVDEANTDLKEYSRLLELGKTIQVIPQFPPSDLDTSNIVGIRPDAVVLDYELTRHRPEDNAHANYLGGSLATRLREGEPNTPILVLTRKSLIRQYPSIALFPDAVDQLGAVDFLMFKDEVASDPKKATDVITAIIDGYSTLRSVPDRSWGSLLRALGSDDQEAESLQDSAPPLTRVSEDSGTREWNVPGAARWILRVLLRFPGVLYGEIDAATYLGLSVESFRMREVSTLLQPASYEGPFGKLAPHWWKSRLSRVVRQLMSDNGINLPVAEGFTEVLRSLKIAGATPSTCAYSGRPHADALCFILGKPVMREFCLDYYPDSRPPSMDTAKVSFKAILEDTRFDDMLLSSEGRIVAESVRREVRERTRASTPPS
jgi:hypothetical protein